MPGPHAFLPAVAVTAVAALAGISLALVGRQELARQNDPEGQASIPVSVGLQEPPMDIGAAGTALLGTIATALGVATTAQTLCKVHHQRVRHYEDRLEADAAAAVRAVSGSYARPLKRKKLADFMESHPAEHRRAEPGSLEELQLHAQLFSRYSLALKLSAEESDWAHDAAVELLTEEYSDEPSDRLAHAVRKAHALAKAGEQSTLTELASFVQKTKASPLAAPGAP